MPSKETAERAQASTIPAAAVQARILVIRNRQVMMDQDLAELYGVETKALTRAVRRNVDRFPSDFMFRLTTEEFADLRSQFGASSDGHGGRKFGEHEKHLTALFKALKQLAGPPPSRPKHPIGFSPPTTKER